jgi:hypothetical protein
MSNLAICKLLLISACLKLCNDAKNAMHVHLLNHLHLSVHDSVLRRVNIQNDCFKSLSVGFFLTTNVVLGLHLLTGTSNNKNGLQKVHIIDRLAHGIRQY